MFENKSQHLQRESEGGISPKTCNFLVYNDHKIVSVYLAQAQHQDLICHLHTFK